jgi:hypothetical protein
MRGERTKGKNFCHELARIGSGLRKSSVKCCIFNIYLCSQGRLSDRKTFSGRTILHGVAVRMDKLAQRGAKLKL